MENKFRSVYIFKGAVRIKEELIKEIEKKYSDLLENGILEDKLTKVEFCAGLYGMGSLEEEEVDKIGQLILDNIQKELDKEFVELKITYSYTNMYKMSFNPGLEFWF